MTHKLWMFNCNLFSTVFIYNKNFKSFYLAQGKSSSRLGIAGDLPGLLPSFPKISVIPGWLYEQTQGSRI